ncbi:hypothetical protein AYJ57_05370 [Salipiger sp. CCB-MM3]|uniref:hypothetical protein n=1 Tax=Salipiger sp. CCB-MM3 TaxID=1792508 RepID=UPI00080AA94B|nr:hypothetical protein [Salipiger sp. CCB-MM3]ANT59849.1 hypothetical protein AYJ57_05370 [Salipiger sp. CCB-MM3]
MSQETQDRTHQHDVAHPHDVRAGPGDAGAWDRPAPLPRDPEPRSRGWKSLVLFCALALVALLIISVFGAAP